MSYYPPKYKKLMRESPYVSPHLHFLNERYVIGCIEKRGSKQAHYSHDPFFINLMKRSGFDVDALKKIWDLTPISESSVYRDFSKYHVEIDNSKIDWEALDVGALWLAQMKQRVLKTRPRLLNYDEVIQILDLSKSATAFYNSEFKNKAELVQNYDFKESFVRFLYRFAHGEAVHSVYLAMEKEEIRAFEKIQEDKMRSIIVGSIKSLITGHMLYADMDDLVAENWLKCRTGIGMSFFGGQYHEKLSPLMAKKRYAFADVGKYDSRQLYYLQQLGAWSADTVYGVKRVRFYELLGSLSGIATEIGLQDFTIDVPHLRALLIEDGVYGPVLFPDGTLVVKDRGENSGNHRTGHSNTDRYKIVEYAAAYRCGYKSVHDYLSKGPILDETGDDVIYAGDDFQVFDKIVEIWRSIGCDVDVQYCDSFYQLEYLGSRPMKIRYCGYERLVPIVNSSKVVAGLGFKFSKRDVEVDINRLAAARVLCWWSEDRECLDNMIKLYCEEVPEAKGDKRWWTEEQIVAFFLGTMEDAGINAVVTSFLKWLKDVAGLIIGFLDFPKVERGVLQSGKSSNHPVKKQPAERMEQVATAAVTKAVEKLVEKVAGGKNTNRNKKRKEKRKAKKKQNGKAKEVKQKSRPKGSGVQKTAVPSAIGFKYHSYFRRGASGKYRGKESLRFTGQDLYGVVGGTGTTYDDVLTMPLNPMSIPGSRLQIEAQLWTKFRFNRISYKYMPIVGTSTNGALLMSHIADPESVLPASRTLGYAQALMTVPGSEISTVWKFATHTWRPVKEDPKEYYIQPDIQSENRFTVQDIFKIVQMSSVSGALGQLVIDYDVTLYDPILAQTGIVNYLSAGVDTGPTPSNSTRVSLNDPGAWGALTLYFPNGSQFSTNTLYAAYLNCDFGGLRAFSYFFFKSPATMSGNCSVYYNNTDAAAGNTSGKVGGTTLGSEILPATATMYYTTTLLQGDTLLGRKKQKIIAREETKEEEETPTEKEEEILNMVRQHLAVQKYAKLEKSGAEGK